MTGDPTPRSGLVEWMAMTVDCPEPNVMADFYAALLGGTVIRRTPGQAELDTGERRIYFRAAADYRPPTWPSPEVPLHSHFDYVVEDPHAVTQHLLPLGGSLAAHQDPNDPHLLVMLDPAGHPFCLIRSSAVGGY
jgi:catechol 2,3-dioxygenase-like lactoylglutathione lyase family enzyme